MTCLKRGVSALHAGPSSDCNVTDQARPKACFDVVAAHDLVVSCLQGLYGPVPPFGPQVTYHALQDL